MLRFMWQEENSIKPNRLCKVVFRQEARKSSSDTGGGEKEARAFEKIFSYPNNTRTDFRPISFMWYKCTVGCFVGQANYSTLHTRRDLQTCHFTENSNKVDIVHFKNPWSINGVESLCKHITKDLFSELRDALPDTWQLIATNPQGLCNPG